MIPLIVAINAVTFLLYGLDKWRARKRLRRIPESWLLWPAAFSGAPAAWIACSLFRHKTRKRSFRIWLLLATLLNGLWLWLWLRHSSS